MANIIDLPIEEIVIPERWDRYERDLEIDALAEDIKTNNLRNEIWVNRVNDSYVLIAGRRRLEACGRLGNETIKAKVYTVGRLEAEYLVVGENSHRINYTLFERVENFCHLVHLELYGSDAGDGKPFAPSRYVAVLNPLVRRRYYISCNRKQDHKLNKDEKRIDAAMERVYMKSGLFTSWGTLMNGMVVGDASRRIRQFAAMHRLEYRAVSALVKFEKEYSGVELNGICPSSEEAKDVVDCLLVKIGILEKKNHSEIMKLVTAMKRQLSSPPKDISVSLQSIQEQMTKLKKMQSAANRKRPSHKARKAIANLETLLEKEIRKIEKLFA